MKQRPKLRTVEKYQPPYPLNHFPSDFALQVGKEIIYLLATRNSPRFEGSDWEESFARAIGGRWKPSNVGLDDVLLEQTAWSAKTVKTANPSKAKKVRLISGRNSPSYSYDADVIRKSDPNSVGAMVLGIWNERVAAIRAKYQHLRTVVLVKSEDLLEVSVFEFDTVLYDPAAYEWRWNKKHNLEGLDKAGKQHHFTWQPHGAQFTIIEVVPTDRLALRLKQPPAMEPNAVLATLGFDPSWVQVI
jgi:hypothetical protein